MYDPAYQPRSLRTPQHKDWVLYYCSNTLTSSWKPVASVSWSITETERRYSQIKKEGFTLMWACEKFADYVISEDILLETDHKSLVPLLGKTNLRQPTPPE